MTLRVAFDTNVWSHIADAGESDAMLQLEAEETFTTILQPLVLMEALDTSDADRRRRILAVLTASKSRLRIRPEAASEAAEFVAEVRRLRPEWMRPYPATDRIAPLETFWTKRFWREAKHDPDMHAAHKAALGTDVRDAVLETQRANQTAMRAAGIALDPHDARYTIDVNAPPTLHPGWRREDAIETWRVDMMTVLWHALAVLPILARTSAETIDTTMADWIGPYVRLDRIRNDEAGFNRLCLYEVTEKNLPRNWLRGTVQTAQLTRKLGTGNPADTAQAAYLLDCDLLLTADRRFYQAITEATQYAPFPVAAIGLIDRSRSSAVDQIRELIMAHADS